VPLRIQTVNVRVVVHLLENSQHVSRSPTRRLAATKL